LRIIAPKGFVRGKFTAGSGGIVERKRLRPSSRQLNRPPALVSKTMQTVLAVPASFRKSGSRWMSEHGLLAGVGLVLAGLLVCAVAGRQRESKTLSRRMLDKRLGLFALVAD
jgi:hypothetical protein